MPVHRITRLGLVNAYLVEEDDGLTLIDTTLPRSEKAILAAAERLGRPIVRIALTHAHQDHIGSLDALHAALPDAEVLISARDARLLAKDMTLDPGEEKGKLRGGYRGAETRADADDRAGRPRRLARGASPRPATRPARSRSSTPATARSTAPTRTRRSAASRPRAKRYWRFPLPASATWHHPTALETAKALRELGPARLAPGHGKVVEAPGAAMLKAIARGSA